MTSLSAPASRYSKDCIRHSGARRSRPLNTRMNHYLWKLRPYFRQTAGQLLLGSLSGIAMNTAVVLPPLLLGRAIDTALALHEGRAAPADLAGAALVYLFGTLAT